MSGPPDKWNEYRRIDAMTSGQVLELLNQQADLGNTNVVYAPCADGKFLFFGNYNNGRP